MEKEVFREMKGSMEKAVEALVNDFKKIKTGRASISLLDGIKVDCYGTTMPLNQVASLSVPESRLILVQPWDVKLIGVIEKAILQSDLGLNPSNDGKVIRIPIPPLTEERRKELVKLTKKMAEDGRIAVRNARRTANEALKRLEHDKKISEDDYYRLHEKVQELTDEYIEKINKIVEKKDEEIMEV